ncbi:hypothetical protein [Dankookia sp. P2]|uniref:hypothetical protein n=1 Tax=Dankookia sp. P2 TaxID=3423955 RepID=UPI003D67DD08
MLRLNRSARRASSRMISGSSSSACAGRHEPERSAQDVQPSFSSTAVSLRAGLVSSCAGTALATVVAVPLVLLSTAGDATADDCASYEGDACDYVVQPPAAPNNQYPGAPGTPVGTANVNIPGVTYAARGIVIQTTDGAGGTGWTYTGTDHSGAEGGRGATAAP